MKSKRHKQRRQRKVSPAEADLLKNLWRWKVLSYPLAKEIAFKKICYANFYNKIRRLLKEDLIVERDGFKLECTVLQLSKKGFEYVKADLGELRENRFQAQSVPHDYWATAVQIGEFVDGIPPEVRFFTEQELQCTDDSLLPGWVPKSRNHIPDGLTKITSGNSSSVLAFEVELNLKPLIRYDKAAYYFDAGFSKFDVVLWVCANRWLVQEILNRLLSLKIRNMDIHQFLLTSDFKIHGWDARIDQGPLAGKSLREIYMLKGYASPVETPLKACVTRMQNIFFSSSKTRKSSKL